MPIDPDKKEEDQRFSLKDAFQQGRAYIDTRLELLKLIVIARASRIIARLLLDVFRGILALLVLFFLSMALGFYLSDLLDNYALGFLATAGIFIVIIIVLSAFAVSIKSRIVDMSIKRIFDDIDEEDEEAKNDMNSSGETNPMAAQADLGETTTEDDTQSAATKNG